MSIALVIPMLSACNNGDTPTDITVVDGYIKNATVTDSIGRIATYSANGVYTFGAVPTYPLTSSGGQLEGSDIDFDITMTISDERISVISPINSFLGGDETLLSKLSGLGLGPSTLDEFSVDYIGVNDINLAKLAQILYLVETDSTLSSDFKSNLSSSDSLSSLSDIYTLASNQVGSASHLSANKVALMTKFIDAVKNYNGSALDIETSLMAYKHNLVTDGATEVTHNNVSYGVILSPHTGKYWLDRNLGSSKICESATDSDCYGDYYQWGRDADGHEKQGSSNISTQATNIDNVGNGNFITGFFDWASVDTARTLRQANWSSLDGSSVCPEGYRVPTDTEVKAETSDLTGDDAISNATDLFNSFLRIPIAGYRNFGGGEILNVGTYTSFATTSLGDTQTTIKTFDADSSSAAIFNTSSISFGISVRCIKN
ncbi:hypothetical protein [Enterovibrio calviensis]|uniref:hypothetical protein n=1 Tax=Enterovibrio calviensis TaxID=91359 RepID=UPI003736ED17